MILSKYDKPRKCGRKGCRVCEKNRLSKTQSKTSPRRKQLFRVAKKSNPKVYLRRSNGQFIGTTSINPKSFVITSFAILFMIGVPVYGFITVDPYEFVAQASTQKMVSPMPDYVMPTVTPSPTPTEMPKLPYSVERDIAEIFGDEANDALKVARCESGFKSVCNDGLNRNGTVDCGVFQVNSEVHGIKRKWLNNSQINIRVAKQLHDEWGNWSPWYSSYSCHGLK